MSQNIYGGHVKHVE